MPLEASLLFLAAFVELMPISIAERPRDMEPAAEVATLGSGSALLPTGRWSPVLGGGC